MTFTDEELQTLNAYLNGEADLPVEVAALNVKLRTYFEQDNSVETPELEAAVAEVETEEAAPSEDASVEETVSEAPTEDLSA